MRGVGGGGGGGGGTRGHYRSVYYIHTDMQPIKIYISVGYFAATFKQLPTPLCPAIPLSLFYTGSSQIFAWTVVREQARRRVV